MKLLQLQLSENCCGWAVFGRLNRSRSAGVGGDRFFFVAVEGLCSYCAGGGGVDRCRVREELGRENGSCRRSASFKQATHGSKSRLSCKCESECSLLTRNICGAS